MIAIYRIEELGADQFAFHEDRRRALNNLAPDYGLGDMLMGRAKSPYWVAEITGRDAKYGYARTFLRGQRDYTHANSVGSRGVHLVFALESGKLYQVQAKPSWSRTERYFARVAEDGAVQRMSDSEAGEWLNAHSA